MNCSPNISIAISLLSLTAGFWLLYKTRKESLGTLFKAAAWFVIVVSLLNMVCCGVRCCHHGCKMKKECRMEMMYGGPGMGGCMMGGGPGCMMGGNCRMMMGGGCHRMMEGGCCKEGMGECREECEEKGECHEGKSDCCKKDEKMDCCKKGEKMEMMKKDTVVIKKK